MRVLVFNLIPSLESSKYLHSIGEQFPVLNKDIKTFFPHLDAFLINYILGC